MRNGGIGRGWYEDSDDYKKEQQNIENHNHLKNLASNLLKEKLEYIFGVRREGILRATNKK